MHKMTMKRLYAHNDYKKLDAYKEMHRTICINIMQRLKWIDQYLYNEIYRNIRHGPGLHKLHLCLGTGCWRQNVPDTRVKFKHG